MSVVSANLFNFKAIFFLRLNLPSEIQPPSSIRPSFIQLIKEPIQEKNIYNSVFAEAVPQSTYTRHLPHDHQTSSSSQTVFFDKWTWAFHRAQSRRLNLITSFPRAGWIGHNFEQINWYSLWTGRIISGVFGPLRSLSTRVIFNLRPLWCLTWPRCSSCVVTCWH